MNEKQKENFAWIGIGVFVLYFLYNQFTSVPLAIFGIDYNKLSLFVKCCYLIGYELVFLLVLFFIYRKKLINDFKEYIKNFKPLMKKYMEYWALAFGLMIISNIFIVTLLPGSSANNQTIINNILEQAPLYIIITSVLFAPLLEEIIFRLSFRNIFKSDKLFIIFSGLVFGSMHVVGSFTSWSDFIFVIPYSIPGLVFAYTLVKSKNIFVPISLHLFHNAFMMTIQFILIFVLGA